MSKFVRIILSDNLPSNLLREVKQAGFQSVNQISQAQIFFLKHPDLQNSDVERICTEVLQDPVTQTIAWHWSDSLPTSPLLTVEVSFLPGVTDRVAFELSQAAKRLGLPEVTVVTGHSYQLDGELDEETLHMLAKSLLCNEVVEHYKLGFIEPSFITSTSSTGQIEQVDLISLANESLIALSQERRLALGLNEMQVLRDFAKEQNRPLTDAELEMVAQTWSEHCYHKTFRAEIDFVEKDADGNVSGQKIIDGLLNTYIRAATEVCKKDWLVSTFVDNAGIVEFDEDYVMSFKVETHNHPSALEPFGGANTGVGGVIRDVIGVSAKPIALTDILCFGPQDLPNESLPEGSLHPRRIQAGVIAGVGDYGNKMGIPTVNGAVLYHEGYIANPLVYCGCVGFAPRNSHKTKPQIGDRLIVLGGKTGRDGLRGATFSSLDLDSETSEASFASTAVQIGDPIVEKDVLEVILIARDLELYTAITDCGAGGLSSAIGEMAESLGAEVELTKVGLKYSGLQPWEVWLSEAQERMVLAVHPENIPRLAKLCEKFSVHWDDVGEMTGKEQMQVTYENKSVVNLPMKLLHEGHPRLKLKAEWSPPKTKTLSQDYQNFNAPEVLLKLLADPNVASKEAIVRTYDHEVQGGTVIKPFTGINNSGPSDGAVIRPLGSKGVKGIAISNGINPLYGEINPYNMALSAVDEAIRNAVAVGADPNTIAILDNFCWGNPNLPDRLGSLVKAAQGCYDGALIFNTPFISGKDSLNNEYVAANGERQAIPGTLLISAIGIVPDIAKAVTMDVKEAGNYVYIVGQTKDELGGSLLAKHFGVGNDNVPNVESNALHTAQKLHTAIKNGLVRSCHDVSEGGLAVAAAEMSLAGGLGMNLDIEAVPTSERVNHPIIALFSESNSRWLVEVEPEEAPTFEETMEGTSYSRIGTLTSEPIFRCSDIFIPLDILHKY